MNVKQKPFDNPKVREAIELRNQQGGAGQGGVQRIRDARRGRGAAGCRIRVKLGPWPYDLAKAKS